MKKLAALILICVFTTSCSPDIRIVPGLINQGDFFSEYEVYTITKGDIIVSRQYGAFVTSYTEGLFFTQNNLPIGDLYFEVGDKVNKGDVLATLDTGPVKKRIADLENEISDITTRNAFINELMDIDIQLAMHRLADARRQNLPVPAIRQHEFSLARLQLTNSQQLEAQEMDLSSRRQLLYSLTGMLISETITAPFDGRVVMYDANALSGGFPVAFMPLIYISDDSKMSVFYNGSSGAIRHMRDGNITGRIQNRDYKLAQTPIPSGERMGFGLLALRPFEKFEILNPDEFISPGQYVKITVTEAKIKDALKAPLNAVHLHASGTGGYVYVTENGQKTLRRVKVGLSNSSYHEITEGIEEGEEILIQTGPGAMRTGNAFLCVMGGIRRDVSAPAGLTAVSEWAYYEGEKTGHIKLINASSGQTVREGDILAIIGFDETPHKNEIEILKLNLETEENNFLSEQILREGRIAALQNSLIGMAAQEALITNLHIRQEIIRYEQYRYHAEMNLNNLRQYLHDFISSLYDIAITAPIGGSIKRFTGLRPGTEIAPGSRLMEIETENATLTINASPDDFRYNMEVTVTTNSGGFPGRIVSDPAANKSPRSRMPFVIHLCGSIETQEISFSGRINVTGIAHYTMDVPVIPVSALITENEGTINERIFVLVQKNGAIKKRYVQTGMRDRRLVHVVSGVSPGDLVLH